MMWPIRSEMTRDECRKCYRRLELDAYGSMISVLRAQGPFTSEKQKLLQELAKLLHISNERHRCEIRRVANDEKLATIAEQFTGPNTGTDWIIEGRRTIPLLPRLKARTAFTTIGNSWSLANSQIDKKKFDKHVTSELSGNSTAVETESQPEVEINENSSVDTKLCSLENDLDDINVLQENSTEDEKIHNKDILVDKIVEEPKISKLPQKRKITSPLSTAPPNKVLVVSKPINHAFWTYENKQESQVPQATMHHQNVALIPLVVGETSANPDSKESTIVSGHLDERITIPSNKHAVNTTISMCTNNASKPKTVLSTVQNKVSTKVVPAVSSSAFSVPNKMQSESNVTQPQDNINNTQKAQRSESTSSGPSCIKRSMTSIIHEAIMSNTPHRLTHTVAVYPGTTASNGPGPPQVKQVPTTLMCKKLSSEQIATINHQSTAKTGVTINSKKVVNMPHYPNTKLNAKTNVIVIQKGHAKGVTLSHAGKEVLGKVIMGGKNLCVTSQHNANSVSVQPHHISLNNGDQTKTVPTADSPQNAESIKTNIKSGKTSVVSVVTAHLQHDVSDKNKVLSQLFDSSGVLNSESKTVQSINTHLPKGECNSNTNVVDRESSLKTDPVITSIVDEKQHRKNKDVNASISQVINPLDSSKPLGSKEILVRPKQVTSTQDHAGGNIRIEDTDEDMDVFGATLDSTDMNLENFQYLVNNDDSCVIENSKISTMNINQLDEHDDS